MQSPAEATPLQAEQCIIYRRDGNESFRLINDCDQPLSVALCVEAASADACSRDIGWQKLSVTPKSELPGNFAPLHVINLFACRTPAVVQMRSGGLGVCDPTGTADLPLLLASSLKNASSIITSADYPRGVRAEGTTRFEMIVTADGRPQSCSITVSAGNDALDKSTCNAFMKRARFSPAKDTSGVPVSGRYRGSVTWKEPQ